MGTGGMVYANQLEPDWVEITHLRLKLPRLGKAFEGFRLVQVSDIHMGGWMNVKHFSCAMRLALKQNADLLALTGDFVIYNGEQKVVTGVMDDLNEVFDMLGDVPRVGVLGNHDLRTSPVDIRKMMEKHQILDLTNRIHTIVRDGEYLHIAGVDDMLHGQPDSIRFWQPYQKTVRRSCSLTNRILPTKAPGLPRFDLQISGHSHGGQVVVPFIGPPYLPMGGLKYYNGLYRVGTMLQYTNRGIGMVEPFVRFNCRPEITVFTLQAG